MNPVQRTSNLAAPRQQHNWDWRAATNFIAGGAGGGLLFWATLVGLTSSASRSAILIGLMLIGCGLTCVWFEIGRPWRALNVYRHIATSWMTREAMVALGLFAAGALAVFTASPLFVALAGFLGLTFLYAQARILAANKGIPAWRHPRSAALMIATGLAEGAGLLACLLSLAFAAIDAWLLVGFVAVIVLRSIFWKYYLGGLIADGAPDAALKVLSAIDGKFVLFGHVLPALAVVAVLAGTPGRASLLLAAGIMVFICGWVMKFALVRRAAFTQGLALQHQPVRGRGPAGASAKPGWRVVTGSKVG